MVKLLLAHGNVDVEHNIVELSVQAGQLQANIGLELLETLFVDLIARGLASEADCDKATDELADGAKSAILLDGALASAPIQLGGLSGSLHILRQGSRLVRRACDAQGMAQGTLTLPAHIVQPGARRHLQVVFKTTSGWRAGATVLHPLALP